MGEPRGQGCEDHTVQEEQVERNGRQDSRILSPSPKCNVQSVYKNQMGTGGQDSFTHSSELIFVTMHYVPGAEREDGSTTKPVAEIKIESQ